MQLIISYLVAEMNAEACMCWGGGEEGEGGGHCGTIVLAPSRHDGSSPPAPHLLHRKRDFDYAIVSRQLRLSRWNSWASVGGQGGGVRRWVGR